MSGLNSSNWSGGRGTLVLLNYVDQRHTYSFSNLIRKSKTQIKKYDGGSIAVQKMCLEKIPTPKTVLNALAKTSDNV